MFFRGNRGVFCPHFFVLKGLFFAGDRLPIRSLATIGCPTGPKASVAGRKKPLVPVELSEGTQKK
jgi:hypothetical protein